MNLVANLGNIFLMQNSNIPFKEYLNRNFTGDNINDYLIIYNGSIQAGIQDRTNSTLTLIPREALLCILNSTSSNITYKVPYIKFVVNTYEQKLYANGDIQSSFILINYEKLNNLVKNNYRQYVIYNNTLKEYISKETNDIYSTILKVQNGTCSPACTSNQVCCSWQGGTDCGCYAKPVDPTCTPCTPPSPPTPAPIQNCSSYLEQTTCKDKTKYMCLSGPTPPPGPAPPGPTPPCPGPDCSNNAYTSITNYKTSTIACKYDTSTKRCCCSNISGNCPTPPPTPKPKEGPPFNGGWNNCTCAMVNDGKYQTGPYTWKQQYGVNTLLIGPYADCTTADDCFRKTQGRPADGAGTCTHVDTEEIYQYTNIIYSVGGASVNATTAIKVMIPTIIELKKKENYSTKLNGISFDAENGLTMQISIAALKTFGSQLKDLGIKYCIFVPDGTADWGANKLNEDGTGTYESTIQPLETAYRITCYMAPMLYKSNKSSYGGGTTTGCDWTVPDNLKTDGMSVVVSLYQFFGTGMSYKGTIQKTEAAQQQWPIKRWIVAFQSVGLRYGINCDDNLSGEGCTDDTALQWKARDHFLTVVKQLVDGELEVLGPYTYDSSYKFQIKIKAGDQIAGVLGWNAQKNKAGCYQIIDEGNSQDLHQRGIW